MARAKTQTPDIEEVIATENAATDAHARTVLPTLAEVQAMDRNAAADLEAAEVLKRHVTTFAAESADRVTLTDADRTALGLILGAVNTFRPAANRMGHLDGEAAAIVGESLNFLKLNSENVKSSVAGIDFETPAIESPGLRVHIVRLASEIGSAIDRYTAGVKAQVARQIETERRNAESVAAAEKLPLVGPTLSLYRQAVAALNEHSSWGICQSLVESTYRSISNAIAILESEGRVPKERFNAFVLAEFIRNQENAKFRATNKAAA